MPTVRKPSHTMWPKYLYCSRGYFVWRDPLTKKDYPLGKDEKYAIEQATDMNARLSIAPPPVVEKWPTLGEFLPIFREHLKTVKMADRTKYSWTSTLKALERIGQTPISKRYEDAPDITKACAQFLAEYIKADKRRMAKQIRTHLIEVFAHMASEGWIAVNPVAAIKLPAPIVKRQRLTLEQFQAVYKVAPEVSPWLPRAMELGIVTVQRREEVSNMTFRAIEDERLKIFQQKTGTRLRIPVGIYLNAVGWSLDDIVKRCRDRNVVSPYLVHHTEHQGRAKPGMRVHPQTIAGAFHDAVKRAGIKVEDGKTPPTFHELRSLGIRLYKAEGYNPKELAGHKDEATTALYADSRGAEWIDVRAK
jgi:enterobacteria phage integrase